jgi:hypothetical protein
MDYTKLLLSAVAVYGVLLISGAIISVLSTTLQCGKTGFGTAFMQGAIWSAGPTIVYAVAAAFLIVRRPFADTFQSFGIPELTARILGVGYLVMLTSWVTSVSIIHNSEKTVCQPDVKEMTDFKKKLMAELAEKEKAKEEHAKK